MADVFHRVYTHAALDSLDTTGGRAVDVEERDASRVLEANALRELDDLLRKTTPEGNATAWVVRRFGAGDSSFGCVIASYPGLFHDAGNRIGVLNHARLVRIGAKDALFDVADLVASAEGFGLDAVKRAPAADRLTMYLDQLSGEEMSVPERPVSTEELPPRELVRDFVIACLVGFERREGVRFLVPSNDRSVMTSLAKAWAALPIGLQRSTSFALGVADGCPVDVVFSTTAVMSAASVGGEKLAFANRYVSLLFDSPFDSLSLLRNPAITSPTAFSEAVRVAEESHAGRNRMTKGKKEPPPRPRGRDSAGSLDPEIVAEMNRQYEAMEESLRDYVRQSFDHGESRQSPRGAETPTPEYARVPGRGAKPPWLWIAIPVVVLAGALAAFLWLSRRDDREPVDRDTPAPPVVAMSETADDPPRISKERQVIRGVIARGNASGKWAEELKTLITNHPSLAAGPIRIAANRDIPSAAVDTLDRVVAAIEAKRDLGTDGRATLRRWLLDVVAASVAAEHGEPRPRVDAAIDDIPQQLLADVKEKYGVSSPVNVQSQEFQSEVILRWMETLTP